MASEVENSNCHFLSCEVLKYMFFGVLDQFPTLNGLSYIEKNEDMHVFF